MKNPWTKKNPFLSMWLTGANAAASQANGQLKAAMARQQANLIKETADFWSRTWLSAAKSKRRR